MDRSPSHNGLSMGQNGYTITIEREGGSTMHCTTLGIDVAKQVFQIHGVDARGQVVVQKRVSRSKLRETIAQLPRPVLRTLHASIPTTRAGSCAIVSRNAVHPIRSESPCSIRAATAPSLPLPCSAANRRDSSLRSKTLAAERGGKPPPPATRVITEALPTATC